MKKIAALFCVFCVMSWPSLALNMPVVTNKNVEPQTFLGEPVRLYPNDAACQNNDKEMWGQVDLTLLNGFSSTQYYIRNVTNPSLYTFLPPADKATGTAVIVAPGGAFLSL